MPAGEVYFEAENPKGILGFYIVSKGGGVPYRLKIRAPSFCNLSILPKLCVGCLVSDVVSPQQLMPAAMRLAEEMANGPQVAMRMLKRSLHNASAQTFEQAGDDIAAKTAVSDHHPDTSEGMAAYRERREPRYNQWLEEPVADGDGDPAWFGPSGG